MSSRVSVKLIKDSIYSGNRLTTLELEYPRYIHAEFMTHRVFSRNAQSSRAIPTATAIKRINEDIWYPIFMKNQPGMQADVPLTGLDLINAQTLWDKAKSNAIRTAYHMLDLGVHKQVASRILEPFSKIKVIVTATEWDNFFSLRIAPNAQQEIQELAKAIKDTIDSSKPLKVDIGNWHLPYIREDEEGLSVTMLKMLSVARCARVSYLNHDGTRSHSKDIDLFYQLAKSRHLSPFEHVATPSPTPNKITCNFIGWNQFRHQLADNIEYYRTIND